MHHAFSFSLRFRRGAFDSFWPAAIPSWRGASRCMSGLAAASAFGLVVGGFLMLLFLGLGCASGTVSRLGVAGCG